MQYVIMGLGTLWKIIINARLGVSNFSFNEDQEIRSEINDESNILRGAITLTPVEGDSTRMSMSLIYLANTLA